jgi:hypothetical protein
MNYLGVVTSAEQVRDNYLILRHSNGPGVDIDEYRTDAKGNRMDHIGLDRGYVVTFGFALDSNPLLSSLNQSFAIWATKRSALAILMSWPLPRSPASPTCLSP